MRREDMVVEHSGDSGRNWHEATPVKVAPAAEEKIHDLMQALEDSVNEAKAERDRVVAARAAEEDHGCSPLVVPHGGSSPMEVHDDGTGNLYRWSPR